MVDLDFMVARDDFTRVGLGLWFHDQGLGLSVARLADLLLKPHRTVPLKNQCLRLVWGWSVTGELRLADQVAECIFIAGDCYRASASASALALVVQPLHKTTRISAILTCALLMPARHLRGHRPAITQLLCGYRAAILKLPVHRWRRSAHVSSWGHETPAV